MLKYQRVWEKVYCETSILATKSQKAMDEQRQFKGGHPDHGPKKGATNLEAGLLIFELRPHFWVRDLALFFGVTKHKQEPLNIGSKDTCWYTCFELAAAHVHDTMRVHTVEGWNMSI